MNDFPVPAPVVVPVRGRSGRFTVGRVFCVGRNYAEHATEMGAAATPIFFMKPATAVVPAGDLPGPSDDARVDHEIELVLALNADGRPTTPEAARALIGGYAVGVDLTRRDLQSEFKKAGAPWEAAKAFDASAPLSEISPADDVGHPRAGAIWFDVDGARRQDGDLGDMILSPERLLIALGETWRLRPGDLVFTGTPAGVGPLPRGAQGRGGVEGVGEISVRRL